RLLLLFPVLARSALFPYTTLFRSERLGGADLGEPLVALAVDPAHEERRHARHAGQVALARFEALEVGVDDLGVALDREEEGHVRSEEHTSELQSRENLVCRLLLEK